MKRTYILLVLLALCLCVCACDTEDYEYAGETKVVEVTDEDGNVVTDEEGNAVTEIVPADSDEGSSESSDTALNTNDDTLWTKSY